MQQMKSLFKIKFVGSSKIHYYATDGWDIDNINTHTVDEIETAEFLGWVEIQQVKRKKKNLNEAL